MAASPTISSAASHVVNSGLGAALLKLLNCVAPGRYRYLRDLLRRRPASGLVESCSDCSEIAIISTILASRIRVVTVQASPPSLVAPPFSGFLRRHKGIGTSPTQAEKSRPDRKTL